MRKWLKNGWMGIISCCLWANVNLVTTTEDIDYRGIHEKAGSISLIVNGNDFFLVTPTEPYYVRIRLDKGARLAETLVAPSVHAHQPIYLGGFVSHEGATINIDPEGIAIARWKAQERHIWLRVSQSSNSWINLGGTILFPDLNREVIFRIGLTAGDSFDELNPLFLQGKANLPSNIDSDVDPVSTLIYVDASQSILRRYPNPGSELEIDTIASDHQTQGVETAEHASMIIFGSGSTANFSGDDVIAIAHALNRSVPTLGPVGLFILSILLAFAWLGFRMGNWSHPKT